MKAAALHLLLLLSLGAVQDSRGAPGVAPTSAPRRLVIAVFDFTWKGEAEENIGQRVGEAIWMKLSRDEGLTLVDRLSLGEAAAAARLKPGLDTDPELMAKVGKEALAADVVVWGAVERRGDDFTIHCRVLDLTKPEPDLYVDRVFPASGFREIPFATQRIVNAIRRDTDAPDPAIDPRDPGPTPPDPKVLARPNLVFNGDFEKGDTSPAHWEPVDGLVSFWVTTPDRTGKCIMFDTDVNAGQWVEWHKKFTLGTKEAPPARIRGKGHKYETVGGTYGAWLYTLDYIPIKAGGTYRISFDFRGPGGGKVFVKAYAPFADQRREVYRAQKNCATKTGGREWEHFTMTFNPTRKAPGAQWFKVELYAYWPPARYYFDSLHLCEEPE